MRVKTLLLIVLVFSSTVCVRAIESRAQDANDLQKQNSKESAESKDEVGPEDFEALSKLLTNSVFEGHFTIDGKDTPPNKEQYFLRTVKKLPAGDFWLIQTRIKYGDHDVTVPLSLPIKWAAKTPVITVDNVTIPGLGTFNARVLIADGKYSGTWQHGKVGGHLYGIIKNDSSESGRSGDQSDQSNDADDTTRERKEVNGGNGDNDESSLRE